MDMNQKMLSDLLITAGVILAVIGWGGKDVGGTGSIVSYIIILLGGLLIIVGLWRYASGQHSPKQ